MTAIHPYGLVKLPVVILAAWLLLHHLWYDFHVQGNYISQGKTRSIFLLSVHAATWTLFVSVPLYLVGTLSTWQFVFLLLTHWAMDYIKGHHMKANIRSLAVDQTVHVVTLVLCLIRW